jgi:hypothetical protein
MNWTGSLSCKLGEEEEEEEEEETVEQSKSLKGLSRKIASIEKLSIASPPAAVPSRISSPELFLEPFLRSTGFDAERRLGRSSSTRRRSDRREGGSFRLWLMFLVGISSRRERRRGDDLARDKPSRGEERR